MQSDGIDNRRRCRAGLGTIAGVMLASGVGGPVATGQDEPPATASPAESPALAGEEAFGLEGLDQDLVFDVSGDQDPWEWFSQNLRVNVDIFGTVGITTRRGEPAGFSAIGLDTHNVLTGDNGDIGTLVLQPYLVRRDNIYARPLEIDQDDAFAIELHDFYFNLTAFGRGRMNYKIGHFDVPFGLEPINDTHFTLHQFIPRHDAGFKKDWGISLNGSFPKFDYEVSLTRGTGMDLSGADLDPYLVAGRIGTPTEANAVLGVSALYGEVIDDHGVHRVDEGDPRGDFREPDRFVRRLRVGVDFTQIFQQFTFKTEVSGGRDFDQERFNTVLELDWTNAGEDFTAYLQAIYLGQESHVGWDEDVQSRLGFVWDIGKGWSVSGQWIHEFERYVQELGGVHIDEDSFMAQVRWIF